MADFAVRKIVVQLEEIRHELNIDRLHAAAIEWGTRVRHLKP